jgi:protein involved in polysaccharide export with SLBB domain
MKQLLCVTVGAAAIAAAAYALVPVTAHAQSRDAGRSPATAPSTRPATPDDSPAKVVGSTRSRGKEYRLAAGDKLRIEVYKDAQLSQSVQVRPDGKITLPLLGDLDAQGATPIELRDRVSEALRQYLNNPVVSVMVVEAAPPLAYVVGEVNRPGPIELKDDVTVLQALAIAGWLRTLPFPRTSAFFGPMRPAPERFRSTTRTRSTVWAARSICSPAIPSSSPTDAHDHVHARSRRPRDLSC